MSRPRADVDEAKLRDCYERDRLSQRECADLLGISPVTFRLILRRLRIPVRPHSTSTPAAVEEAVAAAYQRGWSTYRCADEFGIPQSTIKRILRRHDVALRAAGWPGAAQISEEDLIRAYATEGLSLAQCAARFGIGRRRAGRILDRNGVPRRKRGSNRRRRAPP